MHAGQSSSVVHEVAVLGGGVADLGVPEGFALVKDAVKRLGPVAVGVRDAGDVVKTVGEPAG